MRKFTFINPVETLHRNAFSIIPGIEKVITIYWDKEEHNDKGLVSEKQKGTFPLSGLSGSNIAAAIEKLRSDKAPFSWFKKDDLPFGVSFPEKNPVPDIFTELKNVVLLLRINSQNSKKILIFLYLNENPSNFGLSNTDKPLSTETKSAVAFMSYTFLSHEYENMLQNSHTLKFLQKGVKRISSEAGRLNEELRHTKNRYGQSLTGLCNEYLKELGRKDNKEYRFSNDALKKISEYSGEIKKLEKVVTNAVELALNLHFDQKEIEITSHYITFDYEKTTQKSERQNAVKGQGEFSKTIALLNKLEEAALAVKDNNLKLTGFNVGRHCPYPISAPAISDALYNHKNKIARLVEMYPHRWQTLKAEFRPFKNIIEKSGKAS